MTALLIIVGIIALIVLILYFPLNAYISYSEGRLDVRVKFLMFTFYPKKEKPEKKRKKRQKKSGRKKKVSDGSSDIKALDELKEKSEPQLISEEKAEEKIDNPEKPQFDGIDIEYIDKSPKKKQSVSEDRKKVSDIIDEIKEKLELVKLLWKLAGKYVMKILKDIRIDGLCADITAAGEDACEAALLYGKLNAAVWNIIGFGQRFVKLTVKKVNINCSFDEGKPKYNVSARVNIRPAVFIGNVLVGAFRLLININDLKKYFGDDEEKSAAENEKRKDV